MIDAQRIILDPQTTMEPMHWNSCFLREAAYSFWKVLGVKELRKATSAGTVYYMDIRLRHAQPSVSFVLCQCVVHIW